MRSSRQATIDQDPGAGIPAARDARRAAAPPQVSWRRAATFAGVAVATALAVVALPGLDEVEARLSHADMGWLVAAALLELGSCLAFVAALRGVVCRRLPWSFSARVGLAVQGTNVLLPTGGVGGLAVAAWALHRTGMTAGWIARRTVALFAATSSVNFLTAAVAGLLLAAGLLPGDAPLALSLGPAVAAIAVIAGVAALPRLLERRRLPAGGRLGEASRRAVVHGLRDTGRIVTERRHAAVAGVCAYMFFDLAALAAAFAAVGAPLALGILLVAYPLGQLGGLVPLPGGLGGTDGGLIAVLALYGTPLATAAAAVLAYRVFQLGIPALAGIAAIGGLPDAVRRRPGAASGCDGLAPA